MKSKDLQIKKMEETIASLDTKLREKDLKNKSLQEKVSFCDFLEGLSCIGFSQVK